jgi:class 3 adenylate cyclase
LWSLVTLMIAWGVVSLAGLPPLNGPLPAQEAVGPLAVFAALGVALYGIAAWRYIELYRRRRGLVLMTMAVAMVLLAEAMVAVAVSRNWHVSWWEWHLLMLIAFVAIALGARREYQRSGSLTGAFGGLYLEATLARIDRWHAGAIAAVANAQERGESTDRVLSDLRREGASKDEVDLLAGAARELRRLDAAFRPYLPAPVARRVGEGPAAARLGGLERTVSVLFADLAGFTAFSESRRPTDVLEMLNRFWGVVVPEIDAAGGVVEHFAGDGVMVIFNADGDQPDHAMRAARAGIAIVAAARTIASSNPGWPIFRIGINTGRAVVGNIGAEDRRSFAVIGDTTNVASRLMSIGEPGQVIVAGTTWAALEAAEGSALGRVRVKGKRTPVEAWILRRLDG